MHLKEKMLQAISKEIELQKNYLENEIVETIYFGGGTPSVLSGKEIENILSVIHKHFKVDATEITLEANPDDLNKEKIAELKHTGINRLSIGIQSFSEADLRWMNRAHTARQAVECLLDAQDAGFENLSADLIYGIPGQSEKTWEENILQLLNFHIPHISCYALTVEPKTALFHAIEKKKMNMPDEEQAAQNFYVLIDLLEKNGYEHYEISNFAKEKKYAQHNTSYWKGAKYSGIGPSAHSYNGISRQWNIANNAAYILSLEEGKIPRETEVLSEENILNEFIMTSLRTQWGLKLQEMKHRAGSEKFSHFMREVQLQIQKGNLLIQNEILLLTRQGKFFADGIISDLFFEEK